MVYTVGHPYIRPPDPILQAAMLRSSAPSLGPSSSTSTAPMATVLRANQPRKYTKSSAAADLQLSADGGAGRTVVEGVLGLLKQDAVTITWISRLRYGSAEVFAGQSWLSATLDGDSILAYIPTQGVFQVQDRIFFFLRLFPVAQPDSFGMPTTTIPLHGFTPMERIVKVDYSNLQGVVVLWPSFRAERGETAVYRFVPMN